MKFDGTSHCSMLPGSVDGVLAHHIICEQLASSTLGAAHLLDAFCLLTVFCQREMSRSARVVMFAKVVGPKKFVCLCKCEK